MEAHTFIAIALFSGFFLAMIAATSLITSKTSFPYTVALLILGFIGQLAVYVFHLDIHFHLPPEAIFYYLLPVLLFEAAMHINFHQFRLQFKTISFLSTFGLLVSIFVIAAGLVYTIGLGWDTSLLFGAIISATDPIAVLSLFKTLGAPKRLSLLADGESMFNDATGVIAFRIISAFVITNTAFEGKRVIEGAGEFLYIFIGSIALGMALGYVTSKITQMVPKDRLLVNTITIALGMGSFVCAEHYFHLSGVITTVMAGITFGNIGHTKTSITVLSFIEEFWEYLAYVAVSLVFFFAAFNLNVSVFTQNLYPISMAVLMVLFGRAVSVYISCYLSNTLPFFKDEPNVPLSWQHILNWGGLRGVIPLVLVYSLPDTYLYKQQMLAFTLASLVFTLIVNGVSIKWLLLALKLNLPQREDDIIEKENKLFVLEEHRTKLKMVKRDEFDPEILRSMEAELEAHEHQYRQALIKATKQEEFMRSLQLEALHIERDLLHELFHGGYISEQVLFDFETEMDLQQDAIEYPEVFAGRGYGEGGRLPSKVSYRKRLKLLRNMTYNFPFLSSVFKQSEVQAITDRYSLLRARITTSKGVISYLRRVDEVVHVLSIKTTIEKIRAIHAGYIKRNTEEMSHLQQQYPHIIRTEQERLLRQLIASGDHHHAPRLNIYSGTE